ncbi:Sporulation protein YunB [Alkaliphilus metalliredigens QYMF]|uniref:Sporulation protein YunB n=1 Tax=Alkaliphilus metalliredigens (strain QYMF) TaxID=293826 RepID=A6TQB4_ALKMQ|nr:sporulation protein YunB [Alkaliphilus metalliredigens]ABR48382.1 Sporulation protein YunB [Alkaliphilus metalliredigens QYMF]
MKFRRRRKNYKKYVLIAFTLLVTIIAIYSFTYIDRKIMPTVQALGELKAQELTTRAINESISVVIRQDIEYEDLVSIKEDEEGNITLMQANTMLMNRIASDVALTIQEHLKQIKTTSDRIPLGNALGSQLLAQYGPKIKLSVTPLGMVDVNFGTEFEHSGINQTRHRIFLVVNTSVRVIVPFSGSTIHVTTYVPVAETVIVGRVPMNYINVPRDQFLNIAPLVGE